MNFTRMFILSIIAAMCAMTAVAQSSDAALRDKVTNAVMKVYDEHLAQNPNDYNTLFARAHQHYFNGDYNAAIADVNQALLITPKTDTDQRGPSGLHERTGRPARGSGTGAEVSGLHRHDCQGQSQGR